MAVLQNSVSPLEVIGPMSNNYTIFLCYTYINIPKLSSQIMSYVDPIGGD